MPTMTVGVLAAHDAKDLAGRLTAELPAALGQRYENVHWPVRRRINAQGAHISRARRPSQVSEVASRPRSRHAAPCDSGSPNFLAGSQCQSVIGSTADPAMD